MEDMKNKNLWIGLVVVLFLVAGFFFWSMNKASAPVVENTAPVAEVTPTEDTTPVGTSTSKPAAASISYANALLKYKNARLQLDPTCQASPDKMTFKNGASLMIDNRAPVTRTVKVGTTFSIKAYSFKIIKLSSSTLPATWYVDCDKSQNVSTILIQK